MGIHTQLFIALECKTGTKLMLRQNSFKQSGKTVVKYVNYLIVISIISSLFMKIIEVRENLPKKKNKNKKQQRGILNSQNSFTHVFNIQMTFKYSWI